MSPSMKLFGSLPVRCVSFMRSVKACANTDGRTLYISLGIRFGPACLPRGSASITLKASASSKGLSKARTWSASSLQICQTYVGLGALWERQAVLLSADHIFLVEVPS
eukprot:2952439-Prymnesium_polylepis.1